MTDDEQKEPWFLEINPNGRIPALTDKFTDGETIRVFESGAILQYIVDRYDKDHKISYPAGSREHWEVTSWVSSQDVNSPDMVAMEMLMRWGTAHVADGWFGPHAGPGEPLQTYVLLPLPRQTCALLTIFFFKKAMRLRRSSTASTVTSTRPAASTESWIPTSRRAHLASLSAIASPLPTLPPGAG